jgi:hypothetical protein
MISPVEVHNNPSTKGGNTRFYYQMGHMISPHHMKLLTTKFLSRRMSSSWMLRRVALIRTDISEYLRASIIRLTGICELGTMLAVTSNRLFGNALEAHEDRGSGCQGHSSDSNITCYSGKVCSNYVNITYCKN